MQTETDTVFSYNIKEYRFFFQSHVSHRSRTERIYIFKKHAAYCGHHFENKTWTPSSVSLNSEDDDLGRLW